MKRIISILLVVLSILSVTASAVELSEVEKAELYNLGIMCGDGNGNLRLEDTITRAEAVKMICVAGNIDIDDNYENTVMFPDVVSDHWAYKYILAAEANDIIGADENGNFNPEGSITNEEIVKMIISLLGYDVYASVMGGDPAGYRITATKLNLTKNMELEVDSPAIRKDTGIMVYRALDVPIMVSDDVEGGVAWKIMDGKDGEEFITLRSILTVEQ